MLQNFPATDLADMTEADGAVAVTCEFCSTVYRFQPGDIGCRLDWSSSQHAKKGGLRAALFKSHPDWRLFKLRLIVRLLEQAAADVCLSRTVTLDLGQRAQIPAVGRTSRPR